MEINFCRRCGQRLAQKGGHYECANGHKIFPPPAPAIGVLLVDVHNRVLLVTRKNDPEAGKLDVPGGFCDLSESLEQTVSRELSEELHIRPGDYDAPHFLLSLPNDYAYGGEIITTIDVFFWVRVPGALRYKADDDAAAANWYQLNAIDIEGAVAFASCRQALRTLKKQLA